MPCCSAVNCSNRSEMGIKLYRFPTCERRKNWVQNMRRGDKWTPSNSSRLCEKHFESTQFESHRADSWKKLKPNSIPTLFDVPNPPPMFDPPPRKSLYKNYNKDNTLNDVKEGVLEIPQSELQSDKETCLQQENKKLKLEVQQLRQQMEVMDKTRESFLTADQIKMLEVGKMSQWPNESINVL